MVGSLIDKACSDASPFQVAYSMYAYLHSYMITCMHAI